MSSRLPSILSKLDPATKRKLARLPFPKTIARRLPISGGLGQQYNALISRATHLSQIPLSPFTPGTRTFTPPSSFRFWHRPQARYIHLPRRCTLFPREHFSRRINTPNTYNFITIANRRSFSTSPLRRNIVSETILSLHPAILSPIVFIGLLGSLWSYKVCGTRILSFLGLLF